MLPALWISLGLAAVPVRLPPGQSESAWEKELQLAGMEARNRLPAHGHGVELVDRGATWEVRVRDENGRVRTASVDEPRDAAQREDVVFLALSLGRALIAERRRLEAAPVARFVVAVAVETPVDPGPPVPAHVATTGAASTFVKVHPPLAVAARGRLANGPMVAAWFALSQRTDVVTESKPDKPRWNLLVGARAGLLVRHGLETVPQTDVRVASTIGAARVEMSAGMTTRAGLRDSDDERSTEVRGVSHRVVDLGAGVIACGPIAPYVVAGVGLADERIRTAGVHSVTRPSVWTRGGLAWRTERDFEAGIGLQLRFEDALLLNPDTDSLRVAGAGAMISLDLAVPVARGGKSRDGLIRATR